MKIEFDQKCPSCKGTGLYVGFAEKDGIAVVCHTCKGTGKYHFVHEYEEFDQRKVRTDVRKVIQHNPGFVVGKVNGDDSWVGGIDYSEWLNGKRFEIGMEMRKSVCPAWWYQSVDYDKKPEWDECIGYGSFSGCKHFSSKEKCWERWNNEFSGR